MVTAQLICTFVFAYAKIRFSHVVAHIGLARLVTRFIGKWIFSMSKNSYPCDLVQAGKTYSSTNHCNLAVFVLVLQPLAQLVPTDLSVVFHIAFNFFFPHGLLKSFSLAQKSFHTLIPFPDRELLINCIRSYFPYAFDYHFITSFLTPSNSTPLQHSTSTEPTPELSSYLT